MQPEMLALLTAELQKCHDTPEQSMRWGGLHAGKAYSTGGGCFAGVAGMLEAGQPFFVAFHGDGLNLTFEETVSQDAFNKAKLSSTKDWNAYVGTHRSRIWLEFLLSDISPWRALHPYIVNRDPEVVNNSGFIFDDVKNMPQKLFYNFLMAARFPWELPQQFSTWLMLKDQMDPRQAAYIANCFVLTDKATSLDGPWEIEYPWSFLEGVSLESVYRFCESLPGNLSKTDNCSPNVFPLWAVTGIVPKSPFEERTNELAQDNLSLDQIIEAVSWAYDEQKKMLFPAAEVSACAA
jgi:hypothetical protein